MGESRKAEGERRKAKRKGELPKRRSPRSALRAYPRNISNALRHTPLPISAKRLRPQTLAPETPDARLLDRLCPTLHSSPSSKSHKIRKKSCTVTVGTPPVAKGYLCQSSVPR